MRLSPFAHAGVLLAACLGVSAAMAQDVPDHAAGGQRPGIAGTECPFLAENAAAMDRMMAGMAVPPTGDIDADFTAMMIPHHQGAIDMAVAYLRHGTNPRLRRLAQEIVVEQQQEIAAMRLALGQDLPPSSPAPTDPAPTPCPPAGGHDHHAMRMPLPAN